MVAISNAQNIEDSASWLAGLTGGFTPAEVELIGRACTLAEPLYAGQTELTGTPLMQHALGAAGILSGMNMDFETLAATILHAVPEYLDDWQARIATEFGSNIKGLVEGISRIEQLRQFREMRQLHTEDAQQIEVLRKMLLAMVNDIRVVLIKLAERTQTLRCLSGAEEAVQKQVAGETQSLFAPLANRLGVWQIKWELEDLSVRYLDPELYKTVAKLLDEQE